MICSGCGESVESLYRRRRCRSCYNGYMREYMANRYTKRRSELISFLGGSCVDCSSVDDLQFDHAVASEKSFDIAKRLASASWKAILIEAEKCVLRCGSCHLDKTTRMRDDGSVDHGEGLTGKRNCYCNKCAPLKRVYNANWKTDHKH